MNKNYIIAILGVLLILSTVYSFIQHAEASRWQLLAERNAIEANDQRRLADEQRRHADANAMEADRQRALAQKAFEECKGKR